ncbi:protein OBERON 2 [Macadamia integrifolia]|uniref:protein OBERON 2 n=1 Tax=Macadamia integrifolia TaxID=60698 RepID=UPI001C4E635F|nr:protein OBERON 2 [Macadamia integrifolia]XP_042517199.1 protein OBERON 2 [Macadamia integrifolia]XP_042517200.1 protein OBERON 2 [Macadamia integrifolia]XP_042517201.1 protein OBERON 2 [Macadamia integrifolia]
MNSREIEQMNSTVPDESMGYEAEIKENGLHLRLVSAGESGEGLPYAPIDWPNPGDNWTWKVGKRKSIRGFWGDRYLYPPIRLQTTLRKRRSFASKPSVEQYIRTEFPDKDVNAFFSSFSWKIPAENNRAKGRITLGDMLPVEDMAMHSESESQNENMDCKARNKMCNPQLLAENCSLPAMDCNICCSEPGFCRDCCCILCCKTIDWTYGGYSFIRCEMKMDDNYICGHVAHIKCALRSYMAGTVGGSIGLDVEYYCRRCDRRTDLISHVTRLLKTCESLNAQEDIEKILTLGLCILRGSQRTSAKKLLNCMELAMRKLKCGTALEEIWKEDDRSAVSTGTLEVAADQDAPDFTTGSEFPLDLTAIQNNSQQPIYITSDHRIAASKLEDEIDQVLQSLKRSQETEYRIAKERLYAKKSSILSMYEQLDKERSELAKQSPDTEGNSDALLANVLNRVKQINRESARLKEMEEVAKGFVRVPKAILNEHFGLEIKD